MPNGYGDIGILLPSEGLYRSPGEATEAARIEATKRAAYLSSMDQFYAQFNEMIRQFDITTEMKREAFEAERGFREETLELEREKLERTTQIERGRLSLEEQLGMGRLGLERQAQFLQRQQATEQLEARRLESERQFLLGERQLETQRELGLGELTLRRERFGAEQEQEQYSRELFNRLLELRFPSTQTQTQVQTRTPEEEGFIKGTSPIDEYLYL